MIPLLAAGAIGESLPKILKWGGIIIVVAVIFFFVRKKIKGWIEKNENSATNVVSGNVGMANVLADRARTAMKGWGTNEGTLYEMASVIATGQTSFEDVATAYYRKFQRSLADDIRSELNSKELKKFYDTMGLPVAGLNGIEQYIS